MTSRTKPETLDRLGLDLQRLTAGLARIGGETDRQCAEYIAWLVAGHPWANQPGRGVRSEAARRYPEYDRPGRQLPANPDDDEAFLRSLRERAEQQRRDYQARREQELRAEQEEQRWKQPGQEG